MSHFLDGIQYGIYTIKIQIIILLKGEIFLTALADSFSQDFE